MKRVALAALLLASCTSTRGLAPGQTRVDDFERENQKINESETRCINATLTAGDRSSTRLGASDDPQKPKPESERARKLLACRAVADREREELSARERANYAGTAQQARELNSLMMILTTSKPH